MLEELPPGHQAEPELCGDTGGEVAAAGEDGFFGGMTRGGRNVGFTGAALARGALPGWAFSRPLRGVRNQTRRQ